MSKVTLDSAAIAHATVIDGMTQASAPQVREWGVQHGFEVKTGPGRLSMALVRAFNDAHKDVQYVLGSSASAAQPQRFEYTTAKGRTGAFTATSAQVREWGTATVEGYTATRGRPSRAVIDAYGQAHARTRSRGKASAASE